MANYGALGQQAIAPGLGDMPVDAFNDERVADALELEKNAWPLYLVPVGYPGK